MTTTTTTTTTNTNVMSSSMMCDCPDGLMIYQMKGVEEVALRLYLPLVVIVVATVIVNTVIVKGRRRGVRGHVVVVMMRWCHRV